MTISPNTRPWYKVRRQFLVIAITAIIGSAYLRYQIHKPIEISISSAPTGQDKTLKERMIFLVSLEKAFHKKGWLASLDLEGEDGKTIKVYWEQLNRPMVKQIAESQDIIPDLRDMGFKRLELRNGKHEWDIDLKN
jgi:hypothetical protein